MAKKQEGSTVTETGAGAMGRPLATRNGNEDESYSLLPDTFAAATDGAVSSAEVLGNFELVEAETLINQPFVILGWKFQDGDYEKQYVNVQVITEANKLLCFNDGGVGIGPALRGVEEGTRILVKKGIRKSEYEKEVDGKIIKATTLYLS